MSYTVRAATRDDHQAILKTVMTAFHDSAEEQELLDTEREIFEPERSLVALDGEQIVGHAGIYTRDLSVPGATVPAAFVTMVGVLGTHRRQGIASTLLRRQLADVRAAGEPAAVLWASEGRIYQRYGYGMATRRLRMNIDTREVRLNAPRAHDSRIRGGDPHDFLPDLMEVYEAVRAQRPGYASRSKQWWDFMLTDPPSRRHGAGPRRVAVHYGQSGPDAYALYRVKPHWEETGPEGTVRVGHLVSANPTAYAELWRFLMDTDLTRNVVLEFGSVDEPLLDMVNEPRRLGSSFSDGLWLRLLDVPGALTGRRYAAPVDLVLQVDDHLFPDNTGKFRLTSLKTGAHCVQTTDEPDLALDIATLAGLYLGGGSAGALARAGRITELTPGAIAQAHAAFTWQHAPVGIEMF